MAEFFTTLVPSGPGSGAAAAAAATMFTSSPQSASDHSSSHGSPTHSTGSGSEESPSKAGMSLFGEMSIHSSSSFGNSDLKDGIVESKQQFQFGAVGADGRRFSLASEGLMDEDDDGDDVVAPSENGKAGGKKDNKKGGDKKDGGSNGSKTTQTSAERRATHNAIERARRESLNGRFMQLAASLPSMANVKRPSKSIIVNKSLEYIQESVIRDHTLVKENSDLRREVDELRARLGMPPLPPATPATMTGHMPAVAPPQLIHHVAAPGAATIPPELPAHALHAFRHYPAIPGHPMSIAIHRHHPAAVQGVPGFSLTPETAAMLSPAVFHPHVGGPQHLREDPFEAASRQNALHHGYAGAIMGNPPAMTSPPVNPPASLFGSHMHHGAGSGIATPKAAHASKTAEGGKESKTHGSPTSNGKKRPSPDAEEKAVPASKKRAVSSASGGPTASGAADHRDAPFGTIKTNRSNSISASSDASASSSSHNGSPFSDAAHLQHLASAHGHSLSALGIDVPITQAFGSAMGNLGLIPHFSSPEGHGHSFAVTSQPGGWAFGEASPVSATGPNPLGLFAA